VFDVMGLGGRNVMGETLATRRDLLTREVLPKLANPVREASRFDAALTDLVAAVRGQGLEGLVAKRLDSVYEPGARSGAWHKMRLNRSEEFPSSIYNFDYNLIDFVSDCAVTDTPRFPSASRIAISSTRGILIRSGN
jgi:hypothetical protein